MQLIGNDVWLVIEPTMQQIGNDVWLDLERESYVICVELNLLDIIFVNIKRVRSANVSLKRDQGAEV